ncbi:MAG: DNA polymerase III subunit alpha [Candidatus Obscuribacterales bacterium]|nr:DNA polymerase III subunit alpha [Candidatus Obscuribacterales bacterium]
MYIPLHVYSDFSLGVGTASPADLPMRALELELPAIALTDIETLAGQIRFHHECKSRGVKAISGVELRAGFLIENPIGNDAGRIVLIARNEHGYETLCRIVSARRGGMKPDEAPPVVRVGDFASDIKDNLFVLSDDPSSMEDLLNRGFAASDLRLLLIRPYTGLREELILACAKKNGISVVADPHVVMLKPEDRPLHLLQMAIRLQMPIDKIRAMAHPSDRHLIAPDKFSMLFSDNPEAIQATFDLADQCVLDLTGTRHIFPKIDLDFLRTTSRKNSTSREREMDNDVPDESVRRAEQEFLSACCFAGLKQKKLENEPAYVERLGNELDVISKHGFAPYFLVVAEIVEQARSMGLEIAARGSGVSSLVTFVMGITNIDPVKNGLFFERFLHQHRMELPDIDLDFDSNRRDEIIEWVFRRFGRDRVAMVCSYMTFQRRSALREGLKALGMSLKEIDQFCKTVPLEELSREEQDLFARKNLDDPFEIPVENLVEPYRSFLPWVLKLIGKPHHISIHPGGLVIADREIARCAPIERAPKGIRVTQYEMRAAELAGLVKIDLLGNRCLSELQETIELVKERCARESASGNSAPLSNERKREEELRASLKSIRDIPLDDPETLELISEAKTVGCFQIETPVMRAILSRMPIRGVHDVVAALAIARPGPAAGKAKSAFLKRARGEDQAKQLHSFLEECLRDTYGLPLYDEQIMLMISGMSGWPLAEADSMREQIIHAQLDPGAQEKLRTRFVEAALAHGATASGADEVWKTVDNFAAYSFNKAHACSYALLAYQSAFMKAHVPAEFACSVLNNHGGLYALRSLASDFQRCGVRILAPNVNHSFARCSMEGQAVRIGFDQIKYLTQASKRKIITLREASGPFKTLAEFLKKIPLSAREIEALVLAGVCDGLAPLAADLYPFAHEGVLKALGKPADPDRLQTFQVGGVIVENNEQLKQLDRYRSLVRVSNELKFFHMHISDHPLRILRSEADKHTCLPISELFSHTGELVKIAGMIAASRRVVTRSGLVVHYLSFEDEHGIIESVLSPAVYRHLEELIQNPGPYLIEGKVELEGGDIRLNVHKLGPFHKRDRH